MKEWRAHLQCPKLVFNPLKVPISQLNTWCFIFQKTNIPSSMLDVLSSKSPTFQAHCLWFYLPKDWHSKFKCLVFYLPKVQLFKLNTWCFIFQKSNFSSSNTCGFIFQKSNVSSSMLDVLSSKRLTFQAQTFGVLSSKSPTFQAQCLWFYLLKD